MKIIIVGAVAAGATLATSLRRLDENIEIVMYEKDRYMSLVTANCPTTYHTLLMIAKIWSIGTARVLPKDYNIRAKNYHQVLAIDKENKSIKVLGKKSGLEFEESYDYLVLTTGVHSNVPESIKGTDKDHVFTIRSVVDVENIRTYYG